VKTRPPCAPPAPTGSAAPGRPWRSSPSVQFFSPVLPRQASGWHPLRRGGGVAPNLAPAVICFGATPTPALSVFLRFCWQSGSQRHEPSQPSFRHDPSFPLVRKCLGGLRTGISFRVLRSFLTPQCASPHSRSARPSSSCQPSGLRKRHRTFPNRASSKSQKKTAVPLAQLRATLPRRVRSSHRAPAPRAASGRLASSAVLVVPGASALVPRLCSLVAPAGSLDAAPSGGKRQLSFVSLKTNFVNMEKGFAIPLRPKPTHPNPATIQRLKRKRVWQGGLVRRSLGVGGCRS
jgi:hypothetical protein